MFLTLIKIKNQRDRGAYWFNLVQSLVNVTQFITLFGMLRFIYWMFTERGITKIDILIGGLLVIGGVLVEVVKWLIGRRDYKKWKLWELEKEWETKNKVVAPFNIELRETLQEICRKLDIKDHFRELNRTNGDKKK